MLRHKRCGPPKWIGAPLIRNWRSVFPESARIVTIAVLSRINRQQFFLSGRHKHLESLCNPYFHTLQKTKNDPFSSGVVRSNRISIDMIQSARSNEKAIVYSRPCLHIMFGQYYLISIPFFCRLKLKNIVFDIQILFMFRRIVHLN